MRRFRYYFRSYVPAAVNLARYAWAAPCTLVGLILVAPAFLFGARARIVKGVVETAVPLLGRTSIFRKLLPFEAITFGHVVIAASDAELGRLRKHEHEHVRQYERWGLLFFVAYPAASFWQLLRGRRPYLDNYFEIQARAKTLDK